MSDLIEEARKLVESNTTGFHNLKTKGLGFTVARIAMAELMTQRMAKLGRVVTVLEGTVFDEENLKGLEPHEVTNLYHMANKYLEYSNDFVQKVSTTVDWADLEAQLVTLSDDRTGKVDPRITQGAEFLLQRLAQLRIEQPEDVDVPATVADAFKSVAPQEEDIPTMKRTAPPKNTKRRKARRKAK